MNSFICVIAGLLALSTPVRTSDAEGSGRPLATTEANRVVNVSIDNFRFAPAELIVSVGTTVKWTNRDDVPHTATSSNGPSTFDSKALDTGESYSFTFTRPGTYSYYCKVHTHMTAKINVK